MIINFYYLPCNYLTSNYNSCYLPFIQLRRDLGGVQYTPTILIVFFDDDRTLRAKYEGLSEIQQGMRR